MIDSAWLQRAPTCGDATWTQLAEAVATGDLLLHGSQTPGLTTLEPRAPIDNSPDEFSKQTAVFATEDPTWAAAYGIKLASCQRFLNACFYPGTSDKSWGKRRIFLSYAATPEGHPPTGHGVVYLLPRAPFSRMPGFDDPIFGPIVECQWISTESVPVIAELAVTPKALPFVPRLHDYATVAERAAKDPHGFPWLT